MARTVVCNQCDVLRRVVLLTGTKPHEPRSVSTDGQVKRAQLVCGHSKLIVTSSVDTLTRVRRPVAPLDDVLVSE